MQYETHKKSFNNNKGLNLIELVVVTAIIATFAAIAIPYYKGSMPEAYAPEAEAVLAAISTAQQRYRLEHNAFAGNVTLLNPLGLDTHTTDKWQFSITSAGAKTFTATATGVGSKVPELSGKVITFTYNLASTPHESISYNF